MKHMPLAIVLALLAAGTANAQYERPVRGKTVAKRVDKLMTGIKWRTSLADVKEAAIQSGKMIFWLHVVGSLEDGL